MFWIAGVAQLVRAPPCHGGGRGFKSRLSRQSILLSANTLFLREYTAQSGLGLARLVRPHWPPRRSIVVRAAIEFPLAARQARFMP